MVEDWRVVDNKDKGGKCLWVKDKGINTQERGKTRGKERKNADQYTFPDTSYKPR